MKSKKNLLFGILIGMGMVVVPLILMGSTTINSDSEVKQYQLSTTSIGSKTSFYIYETLMDTQTGEIISRTKVWYDDYDEIKKKKKSK